MSATAERIQTGGDLFRSLSEKPYGKAAEDAPYRRAFNATEETVIVKVRNVSALRPRRIFLDHIGLGRGGENWAMEQAEKGKIVNLDMLYSQFAKFGDQARNLQPMETRVDAIDAYLTWNGEQYLVQAVADHNTPTAAPGTIAPWREIPEGIYDLYFGNHKRLYEMGVNERSKELEAVRSRRRDYCIRAPISEDFMAKGDKPADRDNAFAFLVFERKVVQPQAVAIDMERVYAGRAMEV